MGARETMSKMGERLEEILEEDEGRREKSSD